jgi:protein-arginine kinase activator protein McsA
MQAQEAPDQEVELCENCGERPSTHGLHGVQDGAVVSAHVCKPCYNKKEVEQCE